MFATNDIINDPRVQKEAEIAAKAGFEVIVIGILSERSKVIEKKDGYTIVRVKVKIKAFSNIRKAITKKVRQALECKNEELVAGKDKIHVKKKRIILKQKIKMIMRETSMSLRLLIHNNILFREAKKHKFDICHCNDLDSLLAGYLLKKKTNCKIVYDAHELWVEQEPDSSMLWKYFFSKLEQFLIKKADQVISVNCSICRILEEKYKINNAIAVYNAPFLEKSFVHKPKDLRKKFVNKKIVLYQGRYTFFRGLEQLAKSSEYFSDNIVLVFRGYGEAEKKIKDIVNDLKLQDRVFFVDPVPMEEMVLFATDADIGVIPYLPVSANNLYCTPNKIFEYLMAGLAVVASDIPEMKKIIVENELGLVFDPFSPLDIAEKINSLVKDQDKLYNIKKRSLSIAENKYNWNMEGKKLIKIYNNI